MNVREIIKEAVTRVNLVARRQAVPGDLVETAFRLLKGVVAKYNNDNLLSFTQNTFVTSNSLLTHIYDESDIIAGEHNKYFKNQDELQAYEISETDYEDSVLAMIYGDPSTVFSIVRIGTPSGPVYNWIGHNAFENGSQRVQEMQNYVMMNHVQIRNVAKINSIYVTNPANGLPINVDLQFVPKSQFDQYTNDSRVFTSVQKSEGEWVIAIKPIIANYRNWKMAINFNEGIEFDLDSDLYIPDSYTELLIVALVHKLAIQFPRLDEAQMARLEKEVQILVDNVRTPKAMTKFLEREDNSWCTHRLSQEELAGGTWIV